MVVDSLNSKHFEAKDVYELLNIDKNKLFYWIKTHRLLKPEKGKATGTGTRSKFSLKNLLELAMIKEMLSFGLDLNSIKKIKSRIDKEYFGKEHIINYVLRSEFKEDTKLFIYRSGKKIDLYLQEPQIDPEPDGDGGYSLAYSRDPYVWEDDKLPSRAALMIDIGAIAFELLEELKKKHGT